VHTVTAISEVVGDGDDAGGATDADADVDADAELTTAGEDDALAGVLVG
jgi:hypothetical protein